MPRGVWRVGYAARPTQAEGGSLQTSSVPTSIRVQSVSPEARMSTKPATTFEEVQERVRDVEGWMTPDQARRLWNCARMVSDSGRIVEIGSFRGRSMIVLASAADEGTELIAIDPHA